MRALRWLLLLLLVLLLAFVLLLALFPARLAVDWLGPRLAPLELHGVRGSVWTGQAQELRMHGQPLGAVTWRVAPQSLLSRRIDVDLTIDGEQYRGGGFVSATRDRTVITNARMSMPAQQMQPALDIPALNLRGVVDIELDRAELVNNFPRLLQGRAFWRNAAVDGAAAAELGELVAEFRTADDGSLVGSVTDTGGPLAADGQFSLGFTGFEAEAVLMARDGNPQVQEALRYVGEVQPDGSSILQIRGSLLPLSR
jgi:general secretion pathway protein N